MLKVIELFAGVGGFRLGLEATKGFQVVWGNQWEPSKKAQDAYNCYATRFKDKGIHSNENIMTVDENELRDLDVDVIVGGFPCQDYSVARSLSGEEGIQGKKGVLFWEIIRIATAVKPKYILLENVDRLLKSPSKQRGKDFSIMLASFRDLGYSVEWRVINAAEYGQAQRRRRIFIFAVRNDVQFIEERLTVEDAVMLRTYGFFAGAFPVSEDVSERHKPRSFILPQDIVEISNTFSMTYLNSGIMRDSFVYTEELTPMFEEPITISDILQKDVDEKYYLSEGAIKKFDYLKGSKKIERTSASGHTYIFSEGGMAFPEPLDKPGRTMLTSEGTVNRSTHVVMDPVTGRIRFLTPVECERLNGFPDNWTEGMSERMRYFCMGNALVVGLIERMGSRILEIEQDGLKPTKDVPKKKISDLTGHKFSKKQLEKIFNAVVGKTLGEVDKNNIFDRAKQNSKITGIAGDVIEQSVLGYPPDSKQRPDLLVDGKDIELKTTGIRKPKKESTHPFEAKEPISITAVSPEKISDEIFEKSNFWHKLENMLLVYYNYDSDVTVKAIEYANFIIEGFQFHEFSEEDKIILKNDWTIVRNFIRELQEEYLTPENEYHRISSELREDLMLIDTAPKWPNRPRFRLKRATVSNIVQKYFGAKFETLDANYSTFKELDKKLHHLTELHSGKTIKQLMLDFNIPIPTDNKDVNKSISEQIVVRMFGAKAKKISKIELFNKIGIIPKTITQTKSGARTEDMKLFTIDFTEWTDKNNEFEDSFLFHYFNNQHFLCILFEEPAPASQMLENLFIGFKRLMLPDDLIQTDVRNVWHFVRDLINNNQLKESIECDKEGKPRINKKTGTMMTSINFPKAKDYNIFVRGTGEDSSKKPLLINGINMYRQSVWIKGKTIVELLKDIDYI